MYVGVALKKAEVRCVYFCGTRCRYSASHVSLLKKAVDIQRAISSEICTVSAAVTLLYIRGYLITSFTQVVIDSSWFWRQNLLGVSSWRKSQNQRLLFFKRRKLCFMKATNQRLILKATNQRLILQVQGQTRRQQIWAGNLDLRSGKHTNNLWANSCFKR